jgi:hypothetical protein
MKIFILFIMTVIFSVTLHAQKDTTNIASSFPRNKLSAKGPDVNVSIYPVPVRENFINIKTDREISSVKITNIIGQDIYRAQYNNPQTLTRINLDNPRRGMYLVTILLSDGVRVVKKIMIEEPE